MTKLEVLDQPLYGNSNIIFIGKPIFPQILHRVEYIKFVIYGIVKNFIFNTLIDKKKLDFTMDEVEKGNNR